jgi:hypothetical protein
MSIPRTRYIALAFMATFAVVVATAPSASAYGSLRCAEVVTPGSGAFTNTSCTTSGTGNYAYVWGGGVSISATEECAEISDLGQKGDFTNAECTTSGVGGYIKVKKGFPISGSGGAVKLEGAKAAEATACSGSKGEPSATSQKTFSVTTVYTGCKLPSTGKECKTPEAKEGEIKTKPLVGELGIINKTEETMGIELWPASRTASEKEKHTFEAVYSEFECTGGGKYKVRGAVVGKLGTVDKHMTEEQISFTEKEGKQGLVKLEGVEGEAKATLSTSINGGAFTETGLATEEALKFGETWEIMSN